MQMLNLQFMNLKKIISHQSFLKLLVLALAFNFQLLTIHSFSQGVGVNINGANANPKALLDIDVTGINPKVGLLLPRMTTAERDAISSTPSTPESLLIYNTDTRCFEAYFNGSWVAIGCLECQVPQPTAGTNTPSVTQIVWNWSSVNGATGYQWNTSNTYPGVGQNVLSSPSYTQIGLTCNTAYSLYVWAYKSCGNSPVTVLSQITSCCGGPPTSGCGGLTTMSDSRDSKVYNILQIGSQCWMAQNLNYGTYLAAHTSPQLTGEKFCSTLTNSNDPACAMGGLYEWANMMNGSPGCNGDARCPPCATPVQGVCPSGWHIPSHYEWSLLEQYICTSGNCATDFPYDITTYGWLGTSNEGAKLKEAGTTHWTTPNTCTGGCNTTGFSGLPGSTGNYGSFFVAGTDGYWWSATDYSSGQAWFRLLENTRTTVWTGFYQETYVMSVRCVKN